MNVYHLPLHALIYLLAKHERLAAKFYQILSDEWRDNNLSETDIEQALKAEHLPNEQ